MIYVDAMQTSAILAVKADVNPPLSNERSQQIK